jgi:hypothetical protein
MIDIIQLRPYYISFAKTKVKAFSLTIGKGYDDISIPRRCIFFDVVETHDEVRHAINFIKKLPDRYRNKEQSLLELKLFNGRDGC